MRHNLLEIGFNVVLALLSVFLHSVRPYPTRTGYYNYIIEISAVVLNHERYAMIGAYIGGGVFEFRTEINQETALERACYGLTLL